MPTIAARADAWTKLAAADESMLGTRVYYEGVGLSQPTIDRLEREKRHGTVELLDSQTCRFSADVYDASEILPWLRTFIGRIVDLKCSSQYVLDMFQEDLARMDALYGGGNDVIQ